MDMNCSVQTVLLSTAEHPKKQQETFFTLTVLVFPLHLSFTISSELFFWPPQENTSQFPPRYTLSKRTHSTLFTPATEAQPQLGRPWARWLSKVSPWPLGFKEHLVSGLWASGSLSHTSWALSTSESWQWQVICSSFPCTLLRLFFWGRECLALGVLGLILTII